MEKDDELKGIGNSYDFGARMLDPRIGRWFAPDPMENKYPNLTTYHFTANNPIIYIDFNGEDIVYFNREGKEVHRIVSDKVNETWVIHKNADNTVVDKVHMRNKAGWVKAEMPNMIKNVSSYEKAIGRDYNKHDYQVAASTHLFNEKLSAENLPEKTPGTGQPTNSVELLDPNIVKAVILKETNYGYVGAYEWKKASEDVMQSNVGSGSATINGDWVPAKARLTELKENVVPTPSESITGGILWLYYKGIKVENIKYKNGKIVGGDVSWDGGNDWLKAVEKYNGGGDSKYVEKFKAILEALKQNSSTEYVKEKQTKEKKAKEKQPKK